MVKKESEAVQEVKAVRAPHEGTRAAQILANLTGNPQDFHAVTAGVTFGMWKGEPTQFGAGYVILRKLCEAGFAEMVIGKDGNKAWKLSAAEKARRVKESRQAVKQNGASGSVNGKVVGKSHKAKAARVA